MNDEKLPNENDMNDVKNINNQQKETKETKVSKADEVDLKVENEKLNTEYESLKSQLAEKTTKCDEYLDMLQRTIAEYDNYKKRTQKEKDALSKDVVCDTVTAFLSVADNLERALSAVNTEEECNFKTIKEGVELVYRQFREVLERLDVEEISSIGEKFNPEFHNAVMHIEDDNYTENEIIEVFQKGYILNDRVIRHSVVKVAN